jgi:tetratricopeptide (TPR) repeat protein
VIAARIDRVEENLKGIMQVASVIGREFAFRILQAISGMAEDLKANLINLQGLEFIYEKSLFPELEYIFKHALTQEVVYGSLLLKRRKEIHGRIAAAIETLYADRLAEFYAALAYHYGRSDNGEKAVDYLYLAMQRAIALNAIEQAKAFFDEAMQTLDGLPETQANQRRRIALLVDNQGYLFVQLFKMHEFDELLKRYHSTAVGLGDPWLLGCYLGCMGSCQQWFGHLDDSIATLFNAMETLETSGHTAEVGNYLQYIELCYMYQGNFEKAIALKDEVLGRLDKRSQLFPYVYSLSATNWAYMFLGQWNKAVEEGRRAIEAAEELSNNSMVSFAALITGVAYGFKNDLPRAVEYLELALQRASTIANRAWTQGTLEWVRGKIGDPLRPAEVLATMLPLHRATRFAWGQIFTVFLGELYWLAGEYEKARQFLQECLEVGERCGIRIFIARSHRLLGEVALKTEPSQAAGHFEKSMAVCQEIKAENELALAYAGYGRLLRHQGRTSEAREYLTRSLEILDRLGTLIDPDKVRQELAELG